MATGISNERLRKQALADLQQGRQEMSAEMARLKTELNPQHMAQKAMRRHGPALMALATAAGAGIALLLFRPHAAAPQAPPALEPKKKRPGAVGASLKTLVELSLHTLIKKAADTFLKDFLARQQQQQQSGDTPSSSESQAHPVP